MTTIGTLASQFNRTYIYLNPDPLKGPSTWRLSNIPGINDGGVDDDIENLYTLAPITHTQLGDAVELNFDISAIARDVNQARQTFTASTAVYNAFNYAPFKSSNQLFDLERITAVKPVMSMTQDKDVSIWLFFKRNFKVFFSKHYSFLIALPVNNASVVATISENVVSIVCLYQGKLALQFDLFFHEHIGKYQT